MLNAKGLRYFELFEAFLRIDIESDKIGCAKAVRNLLDLDYAAAVDIWEYMATTREEKFANNEKLADAVCFDFFNQFYARASSKCIKAATEIPVLRRAVLQHSKKACTENSLTMLSDLLISLKLLPSEDILKCVLKNEKTHYGKTLKSIVERVFADLLKKNPARIQMPKPLAELLLTYIRKIKTDERALLEQRIKEIMPVVRG
ncbi:MAG: hypothetical protein FWD58_09025 [Firmicutes bacterium]|nr:hypothetical protein [Bacillota bacterium]